MLDQRNPMLANRSRQVVDRLLRDVDGARAVAVATADGFDVAHAGPKSIDPSKLAAMISSFAALGEAASRETGIGAPRCVVIDSSEGKLVVRCLQVQGESLVLVLLTDAAALLGRVWNELVEAERELAKA